MDKNIVTRELVNGSWFVMSSFLWATIGLALWRRIKQAGFLNTMRAAWSGKQSIREVGLQMGIAFFIYLTGSALRAGYIWFLLLLDDSAYGWAELTAEKIKGSYAFMIFVGILAYWGAVCASRVFVQDEWSPWRKRWSWILMGASSVAIPLVAHWIIK